MILVFTFLVGRLSLGKDNDAVSDSTRTSIPILRSTKISSWKMTLITEESLHKIGVTVKIVISKGDTARTIFCAGKD